jgi:DNA-binding LytR/AlgR family response regulator
MDKKYTAIIVEDERLPMLSLVQKLNEYHPEIEIIATCEDAESAPEIILKLKPQVLFLDIQLSGNDSLWLLEQLQTTMSILPYIIFTTAYNNPDYLLKAIKFQAVDYLLKPVNIVDLAKAITRMKEKSKKNIEKTEKKYTFRTFNSTLVISENDIVYFEADGNYCTLFTTQYRKEPVFERLGEVAAKLSSSKLFIRAGKSHLINRNYIYKIDAKKQICYLKSGSSTLYEVAVSAGGIDILEMEIEP